MEVTAIHGKYLGSNGELQKVLRSFVASNDTEQDLSKHAVTRASGHIKNAVLTKVKAITRAEKMSS